MCGNGAVTWVESGEGDPLFREELKAPLQIAACVNPGGGRFTAAGVSV